MPLLTCGPAAAAGLKPSAPSRQQSEEQQLTWTPRGRAAGAGPCIQCLLCVQQQHWSSPLHSNDDSRPASRIRG